jgi:FtsP/CotA-like multicopper oxidase with cupredoxin domain
MDSNEFVFCRFLRLINMGTTSDRRNFLRNSTVATAGLLSGLQIANAQDEHTYEHHAHGQGASREFPRLHAGLGGPLGSATDRGKLVSGYRSASESPVAIVMPDLQNLPFTMKDGVKEFHLVAEHVRREVLPDQWFDFWGYNGSMPGPLIEAVQGDRVRFIVQNKLPEPTVVHWHGLEIPNAMDGVDGLTQDPIPPGGTFTYEFDLHQNGTFFYHSHGGMQEVMGMLGLFVIHPKQAHQPVVDHDFGMIVQEFAILPQSTIPNSISEEFNFFTINGRSGPFVTPLVVRLGSRVRIRFMNLSAMDHHPMHLHGHTFWITGTEGGRIPESAWIPTNNVLMGVGQSRDVEFVANNPGDWMLHCHIPHHMMNHMVSMVGPMPGMGAMHAGEHSKAMPSMAGHDLASGEIGAAMEPGLGPVVSGDRAVMTSMRPGEMKSKDAVPGYPQDMMGMHGILAPDQMQRVNSPLTRGMRRNWPLGTQAMMTVLRVLPDDLYEKVVSGKGEIEPGASVPGGGPGLAIGGHGHQMHEMPQGSRGHEGHDMHEMQHESTKHTDHTEHDMQHEHAPPKSTHEQDHQ